MILILTQCFPPELGGIQMLMLGLARSAQKQGLRVKVMADASDGASDFDATSGLDVTRYGGFKPLRRWLKARAARSFAEEHGASVIICDTWKSAELLPDTDVPVIVLAHGLEFPAGQSAKKAERIKLALDKATAVVANSRYTSELVRPYISAGTRLCVVNPPIDPLPEKPDEARGLRDRYGHPILVGLARLEPRKGFDRIIEALPEVTERFPGVTFLVAGDGEDKGRLAALAERLGVASHVHFLGAISEELKPALLSAADLFVMPARRVGASVEGFGIVYAEAAWFGVPSLAGQEGGAADFVEHGKTGILVDGERPVAGALIEALGNPDKLKDLGRVARAKVISSGLWTQGLRRYLEAAERPGGHRAHF